MKVFINMGIDEDDAKGKQLKVIDALNSGAFTLDEENGSLVLDVPDGYGLFLQHLPTAEPAPPIDPVQ